MAGKRRPRRDSPSTIRRKEFRKATAELAGTMPKDPEVLAILARDLELPLRVLKAWDVGLLDADRTRQIREDVDDWWDTVRRCRCGECTWIVERLRG